MRKWILLFLFSGTLVSCRKPLFDPPRHTYNPGRGKQESAREGEEPPPPASSHEVWQTALCFPDSVEWRKGYTEGAGLLLLKSGIPQKVLPAGPQVTADHHRFQAGHLWSDYTDGFSTVVCCDGEERFRFAGEEHLQGFTVLDGAVHTLGQFPGGGFCYRIDGQPVFTDNAGSLLGRATDPDWPGGAFSDGTYYTYSVPIMLNGQPAREYKVMHGGNLVKVLPPQNGIQVLDVRVLGTQVFRLEKRGAQLYFASDKKLQTIPAGGQSLVKVDEEILVKGYTKGKPNQYWMRGMTGLRYCFQSNREIQSLFVDKRLKAAIVLDSEGCVLIADVEDELTTFPAETYVLKMERCAAFRDDCFALALTADYGNEHLVQIGDKAVPVQFNGYFTGIYFE